MRGLVFHGPGDIRCERVADPRPDDERGAIVRVASTAICGSDLHLYHGTLPVDRPGFTVGHEFVGEVVETGSGVARFHAGDRVLVSGVIGCGSCPACARGGVTLCEKRRTRVFGTSSTLPGGQAEAVAVPDADTSMLRIPDGISDEQAVLLTDILPTGWYGARNAEIRPGQTVAVIGLGPVGMLALESAWLFGPSRVFAIDRVPERLARARDLGAIALDAAAAEVALRDATGGLGPDCVIEAVGADATIQSALRVVRPGGVVSVIGVNVNPAFAFPMGLAFMKDLTFRIGICPVPEMWPTLVPLVRAGRLHPERVFTHRLPLSDGAKAYDLFDRRADGVLKVLLDPSR